MKKYLTNDFDFVKYIDVADEAPIWSAPFGLKLLDYIDYKTSISAIDIGFGTGFPLAELHRDLAIVLLFMALTHGRMQLNE